METLEIAGDGYDGGRVLAWMIFPRSLDLRRHHLAREMAEREVANAAERGSQVLIETSLVRALLDGPGRAEMGELAKEATKRGTVTGDLLNLVYEMSARGADEPSFSKALAEYKAFAPGKRYGDGEPLKYSEQTLRTYFDDFRCVAHLWGAFRLNAGPYAYLEQPAKLFSNDSSLREFLGVAKGLADFATTFVPKRTKPAVAVIERDDLVHIPDSIPAIRFVFKPGSPPV